MTVCHSALRFLCGHSWLYGVLSLPEASATRGVLIITGGPQYRAGSHRQFTLLAQALAEAGVPVLRFDYRGMGDSEGEQRDYTSIGEDLDCAVRQFFDAVPALRQLVLWGLCDGATAAACYASADPRIAGLVLCNPWVRSAPGMARTTLRHYYLARLLQGAFWRKLASGGVRPLAALGALGHTARAAFGSGGAMPGAAGNGDPARPLAAGNGDHARLLQAGSADPARPAAAPHLPQLAPPQRLLAALQRFPGRLLIILSGDDLTAREFADLQGSSAAWRRLSASATLRQVEVAGANHTFARAAWRLQVQQETTAWLASW